MAYSNSPLVTYKRITNNKTSPRNHVNGLQNRAVTTSLLLIESVPPTMLLVRTVLSV